MYVHEPCMFVSPKKRMVALRNSLLAKAVLCPVSVVKADSVQDGGATNRVRREVSISVATNGPFW